MTAASRLRVVSSEAPDERRSTVEFADALALAKRHAAVMTLAAFGMKYFDGGIAQDALEQLALDNEHELVELQKRFNKMTPDGA